MSVLNFAPIQHVDFEIFQGICKLFDPLVVVVSVAKSHLVR